MNISFSNLVITFLSIFTNCITPLLANLYNSHGILGFVHNVMEIFTPSNYQPVFEWAMVEVPVTSTMYVPQGLIVLTAYLVLYRLFIAPLLREILHIMLRIHRIMPRVHARVQTNFNNGIAFVQLAVEEGVRRLKLVPSMLAVKMQKNREIFMQEMKDAKTDIIDFIKAIISMVKACYTFMKFVWRLIKTISRCIKTGMKDFTKKYEECQREEANIAKIRATRKAERAQEKAKRAFQRKYGITPPWNYGAIITHNESNDNKKVI